MIQNHLLSNNSAVDVINYLLNKYKYKQDLKIPNNNVQNQNNTYKFVLQCTVKKLRDFEDNYNIKYVIIDKSLGIGIIDKIIHLKIAKKETHKILKPITNKHDPLKSETKPLNLSINSNIYYIQKIKCKINHHGYFRRFRPCKKWIF